MITAVMVAGVALTGCSSTRRIDPEKTNSWPVEGTSWRGFCQGRNAFIYVPSRHDSDPDELEAVIYDDFRCVGKVKPAASSSRPDTDPDGIIDDED